MATKTLKATWNVNGVKVAVTSTDGGKLWWADNPRENHLWAGMKDEAQARRVMPL